MYSLYAKIKSGNIQKRDSPTPIKESLLSKINLHNKVHTLYYCLLFTLTSAIKSKKYLKDSNYLEHLL